MKHKLYFLALILVGLVAGSAMTVALAALIFAMTFLGLIPALAAVSVSAPAWVLGLVRINGWADTEWGEYKERHELT